MKILIADDHALFRDGLMMQLEQLSPHVVILQSGNYSQTIKILEKETDFDLIILDLDMPDMDWEEGFKDVREKAANTRIMIISASDEVRYIRKALEAGACGYIPKRSNTKILANALQLVLDGGTYIPPELLTIDCANQKNCRLSDHKDIKSKGLTGRQQEVLLLIAEGKSNKQIAYELDVSEATVKLHINALLRSLGVTNRTQAVVTAQKQGLI